MISTQHQVPVQQRPDEEGTGAEARLSFNRSVAIEGRAERITGNSGILALRELDEKLGLASQLAADLHDPRKQKCITHPFVELLRTRIYTMALGLGDQDVADALRDDPAARLAVSERRGIAPLLPVQEDDQIPDGLASQPTQSRLAAALSEHGNLDILQESLVEWAARDLKATPSASLDDLTLDIDSHPLKVHGHQLGSEYNRYYDARCFHPLVIMLGGSWHWLAATLRPGHVNTAFEAVPTLLRVIEVTEQRIGSVAAVRGDSGFASHEVFSALEERDIRYAMRLKNVAPLQRLAATFARPSPGPRPAEPRTWLVEQEYAAADWDAPRRAVLVIQEFKDQLFPHYFHIATNYTEEEKSAEEVLEFYRQRGTMEAHVGELQNALSPSLSSANRAKSHIGGKEPKTKTPPRDSALTNQATFYLYALAYNLATTATRLLNLVHHDDDAPQVRIKTLQNSLLRLPARIIVSARRAVVVMEAMAARRLTGLLSATSLFAPQLE